MRIYVCFLLSVTMAAVGCTSKPVVQSRAVASIMDLKDSKFKLIPMATLSSQNRGLFIVENINDSSFTIAECGQPKTKTERILSDGTKCELIGETWMPGAEEWRQAFDQKLTQNLDMESDEMTSRWKIQGRFLAAFAATAIGAGIGFQTLAIAEHVRLNGNPIPAGRIAFGAGALTGIVILAIFESVQRPDVKLLELEHQALRANPSMSGEQVREYSTEAYVAIRRSLLFALKAAPSA